MKYVIFASGGNDSVALIQFAIEEAWDDVIVAYSNTQWASPEWPQRIVALKDWLHRFRFKFYEIQSEGMDALITRKQAFPANKPKFCTYELKIKPAQVWLDTIDPNKNAVCCLGIRRCESASRSQWPEWVECSENHGGRPLFSPLVRYSDEERNALLRRAGWDVLPHRSRECSPCVNAKKSDLRMLPLVDIEKVRRKELEMGLNMFRPHRMMGAKGIDEAMKWANSGRGEYEPPGECDSGMCEA
jgi:3'-phosphoadenosine 5'-phosphosulfate sulfotransferase (PAPS reductase)/FAD synthetase